MKVAQSCLTLCNTMDCTVHGILQARILEWVAFPFSRGSFQPRDQIQVSHVAGRFFTSRAYQGSPRILKWVAYPFSSGSSRPRNWTGVSRIAGGFFTSWDLREALYIVVCICQSQSRNPSHPPFPLVSHTVVLYFSNKFVSAVFLDSTYRHTYVFPLLTFSFWP